MIDPLSPWLVGKLLDSFLANVYKVFSSSNKLVGVKTITEPVTIFYGRLEAVPIVGSIESFPLPTRDTSLDPIVPEDSYQLPPNISSTLKQGVIFRSLTGQYIRGPRALVGECEAIVTGYIGALLARSGRPALREISLQPAANELSDGFNRSVFSIGGPTSNLVTRQYLESGPHKFSERGDSITSESGKSYSIESGSPYDYAILKKTINRHGVSQDEPFYVLVMAGLGEVGTQAAGRFLYTNVREILKKVGTKEFSMIIKANAIDPADMTIVEVV